MAAEICKPEIQRIRYKKGQLLSSHDLRDDSNIANMMRWLHNRALHESYGINNGMTVNPIPDANNVTYLEITPGLAYDCYGRELMLQESRRIASPQAPQNKSTKLTLLISYKETNSFSKKTDIKGSCIPGRCRPLLEQPEFKWKPESHIELTDGVPLATIQYQSGIPQLVNEVMPSPISRPLAKPRMASGSTIPTSIEELEPWTEEIEIPDGIKREYTLGFLKRIDTSTFGFTEVPCYFASLQGYIKVDGTMFPVSTFPTLFQQICEPKKDGFIFRVLIPPITYGREFIRKQHVNVYSDFKLFQSVGRNYSREPVIKSELYVSWLGIQPQTKTE